MVEPPQACSLWEVSNLHVAAERLFTKLYLGPFVDMIKNTLKDGLKEFKLVINHSWVDRSNEIWVFPNFAARFLFPKEGSKSISWIQLAYCSQAFQKMPLVSYQKGDLLGRPCRIWKFALLQCKRNAKSWHLNSVSSNDRNPSYLYL